MKLIRSGLEKIVAAVMQFFGIGILSAKGWDLGRVEAMYGVPPNYRALELEGVVMGDIDGDGVMEPVPGIRVELKDSGGGNFAESVTDERGRYSIADFGRIRGGRSLEFADVDGKENGAFRKKALPALPSKSGSLIVRLEWLEAGEEGPGGGSDD